MRRRIEHYSSLGTAIGLLAIAAALGIIAAVLLAAFRGAQWLIGTISGFLV